MAVLNSTWNCQAAARTASRPRRGPDPVASPREVATRRSGQSSGPEAQDYLAPVTGEQPAALAGGARSMRRTVVVVLTDGRKALATATSVPCRCRFSRRCRRSRSSTRSLTGLQLAGERLIFADTDSALHVLDAKTFDPVAHFKLPKPASAPPWLSGNRVYVETGRDRLICFEVAEETGKSLRNRPPTDLTRRQPGRSGRTTDYRPTAMATSSLLTPRAENGSAAIPILGQPIDHGPWIIGLRTRRHHDRRQPVPHRTGSWRRKNDRRRSRFALYGRH